MYNTIVLWTKKLIDKFIWERHQKYNCCVFIDFQFNIMIKNYKACADQAKSGIGEGLADIT